MKRLIEILYPELGYMMNTKDFDSYLYNFFQKHSEIGAYYFNDVQGGGEYAFSIEHKPTDGYDYIKNQSLTTVLVPSPTSIIEKGKHFETYKRMILSIVNLFDGRVEFINYRILFADLKTMGDLKIDDKNIDGNRFILLNPSSQFSFQSQQPPYYVHHFELNYDADLFRDNPMMDAYIVNNGTEFVTRPSYIITVDEKEIDGFLDAIEKGNCRIASVEKNGNSYTIVYEVRFKERDNPILYYQEKYPFEKVIESAERSYSLNLSVIKKIVKSLESFNYVLDSKSRHIREGRFVLSISDFANDISDKDDYLQSYIKVATIIKALEASHLSSEGTPGWQTKDPLFNENRAKLINRNFDEDVLVESDKSISLISNIFASDLGILGNNDLQLLQLNIDLREDSIYKLFVDILPQLVVFYYPFLENEEEVKAFVNGKTTSEPKVDEQNYDAETQLSDVVGEIVWTAEEFREVYSSTDALEFQFRVNTMLYSMSNQGKGSEDSFDYYKIDDDNREAFYLRLKATSDSTDEVPLTFYIPSYTARGSGDAAILGMILSFFVSEKKMSHPTLQVLYGTSFLLKDLITEDGEYYIGGDVVVITPSMDKTVQLKQGESVIESYSTQKYPVYPRNEWVETKKARLVAKNNFLDFFKNYDDVRISGIDKLYDNTYVTIEYIEGGDFELSSLLFINDYTQDRHGHSGLRDSFVDKALAEKLYNELKDYNFSIYAGENMTVVSVSGSKDDIIGFDDIVESYGFELFGKDELSGFDSYQAKWPVFPNIIDQILPEIAQKFDYHMERNDDQLLLSELREFIQPSLLNGGYGNIVKFAAPFNHHEDIAGFTNVLLAFIEAVSKVKQVQKNKEIKDNSAEKKIDKTTNINKSNINSVIEKENLVLSQLLNELENVSNITNLKNKVGNESNFELQPKNPKLVHWIQIQNKTMEDKFSQFVGSLLSAAPHIKIDITQQKVSPYLIYQLKTKDQINTDEYNVFYDLFNEVYGEILINPNAKKTGVEQSHGIKNSIVLSDIESEEDVKTWFKNSIDKTLKI